jgi:pSer/pThr/pTyr-binding forkhead associated (FHA) protein
MEATLVMKSGDGAERAFPVGEGRMVIGRSARADIRVALPAVEERHCEVIREGDGLRLRDLGSAEGTYRNGRRVEDAPLRDGDRVSVGPVTWRVRLEREDPSARSGRVARRMDGQRAAAARDGRGQRE